MEHIERAIARSVSGASDALTMEHRRFATAIEAQAFAAAPTRAWSLSGSVQAWQADARTLDPTWLARVDPQADSDTDKQ